MPTITNNLYPPIFNQSYMPAFIYTGACRVYFSISSFNSESDLKPYDNVQISIKSQRANQSVLKSSMYPSGIKIDTIHKDNNRESDDKYYVDIDTSDIQGGFNLNEYYKVQLRFIDADASDPPSSGVGIDGWLSSNLNHFSEWSSIVLIYGISEPVLNINGLTPVSITTFPNIDIPIVGEVSFEAGDTQVLKSYRVYVYNTSGELIQDSGDVFTNSYQSPNQINYYIKYNLEKNKIYVIQIQISTQNLYSFNILPTYQIKVDQDADHELSLSLETFKNDNLGCIKLVLEAQTLGQTYTDLNWRYAKPDEELIGKSLVLTLGSGDDEGVGYFRSAKYVDTDVETPLLYLSNQIDYDLSVGSTLVIRRTSNKSNFKEWQNVDKIEISESNVISLEWKDYTVQPGTWYKYYIIRYAPTGERAGAIYQEEPIMVLPEDILLQSNGQQLRIRFDASVDSFSRHISQSLVETIGSKYPYIRRNGNVGYRSFSLSGLITSFMDLTESSMKGSREEIFQDAYDLYDQYNRQNGINLFYDYVYQREFRQKVMDFLYEDNVKLFRSTPEGNIMVKLMDINFSPNPTLGRLLYSFSCTAYEIQDCNLENYNKYNIIKNNYTVKKTGDEV